MNRYVQWKKNNPDSYKEVLRRRRERYREDEEFKQSQLQHTADWRKKQKRKKRKKAGKRLPKPKLFMIEDRKIECWSAGRTAQFLGVAKNTLTNLEKAGTIPTNHLVDPTNRRRWWPAEFVRWIQPYFEEKSEISPEEFLRRVWIGWSEEQIRGIIPVVSGDSLRKGEVDDGEAQEQSVDS
jgi:hypothetical protein